MESTGIGPESELPSGQNGQKTGMRQLAMTQKRRFKGIPAFRKSLNR